MADGLVSVRVLYLGDQDFDYVSDPLYIGLSRTLGHDAVLDYPHKRLYHDPNARNWFVAQRPGGPCSREEVLDLLRDRAFDLVCIASFRRACLDEAALLHARVPLGPVVFIDGADDARIRHEIVARYPIGVYFKRDYIWRMGSRLRDLGGFLWAFRGDRRLFERTVPLPLSLIVDALSVPETTKRDIDVSYTGRASHPRRIQAVSLLSDMRGVRFEGGVYASPEDRQYKLVAGRWRRLYTKLAHDRPASQDDRLRRKTPADYYREIARSRIALAIRGGGWTASPRYYEIPALGTMLLSDAPETVIPNDFEDRRHAVFCRSDLSNLEALVRHYLHEDAEREAIAREGRAHLLKYHTCERRADYFIDTCRRML